MDPAVFAWIAAQAKSLGGGSTCRTDQRFSIWVWPIDQSALQALGTAGRNTIQYCDEFSPGRGKETIGSAPGWTVGVLTETLCGSEARRRVNWFLVHHLLTYNMEHEWFSIPVSPYTSNWLVPASNQ